MTDLPPSPVSPDTGGDELRAQLLDIILNKLPPLLDEGLYLAAIPHSYNTALIKALRARDDGRDEKLVARLARFSFVRPVEVAGDDEPRYAVSRSEREILHHRYIADDPQAYVEAHRRTLAFREAHPNPDPFIHAQSRLYHLLIVDYQAGLEHLVGSFQAYTSERRLAAAERLLFTAAEARSLLAALGSSHLAGLDDWLAYLNARLAQFHGRWKESLDSLKALREKLDISPQLLPYVARAYGIGLAQTNLYVEAIEQYQVALEAFRQQPMSAAEQAFTMINLGDAHVDLAISARGQREIVPPKSQAGHWWQWPSDIFAFFTYLPLIVYLSSYFGSRMWHPKSWRVLHGQDWIIARLFGISARWNRRADRLLKALDTHAEQVQADERLAYLYLTMGDVAQAARLYQALLEEEEAPLGEYRRTRVRLGLGQAILRLGQPAEALAHLAEALPAIRAYQDVKLETQARSLIAEANLETGRGSEAMRQYLKAMRLYQEQDDLVGATEIAERLGMLEQNQRLDAQEREVASTTVQRLARRQYLVHFYHPAIAFFRRIALVPLGLLTFLIPILAIQVETKSQVLPDTFHASPLLVPVEGFNPTLIQTVALRVLPSYDAGIASRLVLGSVLAYLFTYTLLGLLVIARTHLGTVQAAREQAVRMDFRGLMVGRGESVRTISWPEVTNFLTADVKVWGNLIPDNSALVVATPQEQITISGNTAWYTTLRERLRRYIPPKVQVTDLSYNLLRGKMGALYGLSVLIIFAFVLLGVTRNLDLLAVDLPGTPYNAADIYPYLYLGMFLALSWWGVVKPLHIHARIRPGSRLVWWISGIGITLAGLRWATFPKPWLSQPDIYPYLAIIALLGSAAFALWVKGLPAQRDTIKHLYPLRVREIAIAVAVVVSAWAGLHLWREVSAHHYLTWGNTQRDRAYHAEEPGQLEAALASYNRALENSPQNAAALTNRAAVQAQLGQYQAAIADYNAALQYSQDPGLIYLNRALSYESWGRALSEEGETETASHKFAQALEDFDQLVHLYPDNAEYYLWRGLAHHSRGELGAALRDYNRVVKLDPQNARALTGQGWVYFQRAHAAEKETEQIEEQQRKAESLAEAQQTFGLALDEFQVAAQYDPSTSQIWLAIGYAHYRLGDYEATLADWSQAIEVAPQDPVMIISRGTAHWLMATPAGNDCFANASEATLVEIAQAIQHLELAIEDFNRALVLEPDNHYTYQTRGQVEWMLRKCPGHDPQEQLQKAIASYSEAIEYAPPEEEDGYWQRQARLKYELGQYIFNQGPDKETEARDMLEAAIEDINQAYALDPDERSNQEWRDFIVEEGWGYYHLIRGWSHYKAGEYELALWNSEIGARLLPQHAGVAFNAGLAALALNDVEQANEWYEQGIERAMALEGAGAAFGALQEAINDLNAAPFLNGALKARPELNEESEEILEKLQTQLDSLDD